MTVEECFKLCEQKFPFCVKSKFNSGILVVESYNDLQKILGEYNCIIGKLKLMYEVTGWMPYYQYDKSISGWFDGYDWELTDYQLKLNFDRLLE